MFEENRIPIDEFVNFNRASVGNEMNSLRYASFMGAIDEQLARARAERRANPPAQPDWRAVYVVGWEG